MTFYCKFTIESGSKRLMKIREHLANLQARRLWWHPLSLTVYSYFYSKETYCTLMTYVAL